MADLSMTSVATSGFPFGPAERGSTGGPPPASLDEMKEAMGVLLVPQFVPEGFAYKRGQLMQGRYPSLMYEGAEMPVDVPVPGPADGTKQRMTALISVSQYPEANIKVAAGYARTISVRGGQGQLVHGSWGRILRNEEVFWSGWAPDTARALYFEYQGIVVAVAAEPAGAATDEILIQMAESLTPH